MRDWRRHIQDLSGASVASFVATAVDGLVYLALTWTLVERGVLQIGVAAGLAAVFGGLVHFSLSRFWVFRRFRAPLLRSAATYFAMSWFAAVLHGAATGSLARRFPAEIAWFLSKGLVWIGWTFPMSRWVVFGGFGRRDSNQAGNSDEFSSNSTSH